MYVVKLKISYTVGNRGQENDIKTYSLEILMVFPVLQYILYNPITY